MRRRGFCEYGFGQVHRIVYMGSSLALRAFASSHQSKINSTTLVSFKDAKVALLEWSDVVHDLMTVSIHTYERAPQLMALDSSLFPL
ncbi:hypothetical protein A0H81_02689 [Grifola frondosa]|uniref:Uncharacterized protein n=1 Tax=Grifola frondosa TaxID=5627 RepID=A0A1C7MM98_GRIFR|nr:hypothetical protein A0H81_02689 [Grifola frondosa]